MIHKYRKLKTSWGIAIDVDITITKNYNFSLQENLLKLSENIFLEIDDSIFIDEANWVKKGVTDMIEYITQEVDILPIHIKLNKLIFNFVDFQEEGIYCAIQEGISKELDINYPKVNVSYNKVVNRYIFSIEN